MTRALFIPFSDCRPGVIRALVHEHGRLAVTLYPLTCSSPYGDTGP